MIFYLIYIPFEVGFLEDNDYAWGLTKAVMNGVTLFFDSLFMVDMFLSARMCFYEDGILIDDGYLCFKKYLRVWFTIDAISNATTIAQWLADAPVGVALILKDLRLLKAVKLFKTMRRWGEAVVVGSGLPSMIAPVLTAKYLHSFQRKGQPVLHGLLWAVLHQEQTPDGGCSSLEAQTRATCSVGCGVSSPVAGCSSATLPLHSLSTQLIC